ncbi:MAG TPA: hypothetical protein PK536_13355 [Ignavibacteria bacterium]|nr:hypothetical protein [Ignavibacteria bacterium]HRJ99533.1 hypothetical protein [Ignavibacteria bacterium]
MKLTTLKLIFTAVLFLGLVNILSAQSYKINLYSGYTFEDNIEAVTSNNNYFKGTINSGYQWGAGFEYILKPTYGIELAYFRQDTDFPVNFSTNNNITDTNRTFGLGMNFIMLAGNKYIPIPGSILTPYGGLMVGMSIMNNKDPLPGAETSITNFAWGGRAGVFLNFSNNVGLKLHAQLLSAVQSFGGGLYLGTGGVGAGLDTESSMYQFGMGGALVFQFGAKPKPRIKR